MVMVTLMDRMGLGPIQSRKRTEIGGVNTRISCYAIKKKVGAEFR